MSKELTIFPAKEGLMVAVEYARGPSRLLLRRDPTQFPPRYKLDLLLRESLAKLFAGEEVVVALPPGCTPCSTLARGRF